MSLKSFPPVHVLCSYLLLWQAQFCTFFFFFLRTVVCRSRPPFRRRQPTLPAYWPPGLVSSSVISPRLYDHGRRSSFFARLRLNTPPISWRCPVTYLLPGTLSVRPYAALLFPPHSASLRSRLLLAGVFFLLLTPAPLSTLHSESARSHFFCRLAFTVSV